ncbi:hypothetical protein FOA52_009800 [Chlamydomonas sp. UWO 241]|nr:hypothetical protein FOA52_009800 [Chlamydomonas sp. UWO 241]
MPPPKLPPEIAATVQQVDRNAFTREAAWLYKLHVSKVAAAGNRDGSGAQLQRGSLPVQVKYKASKIAVAGHPAFGQYGLFAAAKITGGELILNYCGRVHTEAESDPTSDYDIRFLEVVTIVPGSQPAPAAAAPAGRGSGSGVDGGVDRGVDEGVDGGVDVRVDGACAASSSSGDRGVDGASDRGVDGGVERGVDDGVSEGGAGASEASSVLSTVTLSIDAARVGNYGRFVNDFRGICARPNVEFREYIASQGEVQMGVWALSKDIPKGTELCVTYGKGFWGARAS